MVKPLPTVPQSRTTPPSPPRRHGLSDSGAGHQPASSPKQTSVIEQPSATSDYSISPPKSSLLSTHRNRVKLQRAEPLKMPEEDEESVDQKLSK